MKTPSNPQKDDAKKPLDPREDPLARDSRGNATREEIRAKTPMVNAPRRPEGAPKRRE